MTFLEHFVRFSTYLHQNYSFKKTFQKKITEKKKLQRTVIYAVAKNFKKMTPRIINFFLKFKIKIQERFGLRKIFQLVTLFSFQHSEIEKN